MSNKAVEKRIIAFPFAFISGMSTGVNVDKSKAFDIYWKNLAVSSASAKHCNPDCIVAVVTNIEEKDIPDEILSTLKLFKVEIIIVPFDRFIFKADYTWALAFYKLCALSHLSEMGYDKICYLDADVYVQSSLDNAWEECSENLLLYDINHGLGAAHYREFCREVRNFCGESPRYITQFGGEFFMANICDAKEFLLLAEKIYDEMIERDYVALKGDEFIVGIAAHQMKTKVKNAGAYVFRFWTGVETYIVSTCYMYNAVSVLHLPVEKGRGMLRLYDSYFKKGRFPDKKTVWRICRISRSSVSDRIKRRLLRKKR